MFGRLAREALAWALVGFVKKMCCERACGGTLTDDLPPCYRALVRALVGFVNLKKRAVRSKKNTEIALKRARRM